jgi:protein-S-isoprenylcysteine O-methyltransferase Ste14
MNMQKYDTLNTDATTYGIDWDAFEHEYDVGALVFIAGYGTDSNFVLVCGVVFFAAVGFAYFTKHQLSQVVTSIHTFTKTSELLTANPFFSRKSMYLTLIVGLISCGITLVKVAPFVVMPLFIMWVRNYFICYERQLMAAHIGDHFKEYKHCGRRWV